MVRNAGDGTLSVFLGNGQGGVRQRRAGTLRRPGRLGRRPADLDGTGTLDLVVTNKVTGQVSVLLNLGDGTFAPPCPIRAGTGPYGARSSRAARRPHVLEATAGVAVGAFTPGGPPTS